MAAIYTTDSELITEGLQGSNVCDEGLVAARQIAAERGEPVLLVDDDGEWVVEPDGTATPTVTDAQIHALRTAASREASAYVHGAVDALLALDHRADIFAHRDAHAYTAGWDAATAWRQSEYVEAKPAKGRSVAKIAESQAAFLSAVLLTLDDVPTATFHAASRHTVIGRVLSAAADWNAWVAADRPPNADGDDVADEALTWRAIDWEIAQWRHRTWDLREHLPSLLSDLGLLDG